MSNIDKRATELLIENGVLVADTLRHLADNEIDSDYFAICHSNENGTEIECELAITDYARQAAGTVDELVNALEAAEKRIAELENDEVRQRLANAEQQLHIAELEKYNLRAKSKAQYRKRKAAELRVAELEAVKFKLSDPKLLSLAKDIVENLVDTGGSDPEYTQQYVDWTFKRIRAAAGKGE